MSEGVAAKLQEHRFHIRHALDKQLKRSVAQKSGCSKCLCELSASIAMPRLWGTHPNSIPGRPKDYTTKT